MAMRAFFDESGLNPHEDKALIMGGFLGTVEEWERTSEEWDAYLLAPPAIDYFKGDEANNLQGEFLRFNRAVADQKKNDLAAIVGASELQGFCVSVKHDFLAHRDPSATKRRAGSRTYDWGFFTATSGILQHVRDHHPGETVDFVFDNRRELAQCILRFSELKDLALEPEMPWGKVFCIAGTCSPGNDKETAALQMCDLLAGEFSAMANSDESPSEAWKRLVARRGIIHVRCDMPWAIPFLVALEGEAKQIKAASGRVLKRIYGDKERTLELCSDCDELIAKQIRFKAAVNTLMEIHQADEGFRRFQEIIRSKDQLE